MERAMSRRHVKRSSCLPPFGSMARVGVACCFLLSPFLSTAPVAAQSFAPPLVPEPSPQGGRYCIDYSVINNTQGEASILFQDSNEQHQLEPGQSVTHHNNNCFQPPMSPQATVALLVPEISAGICLLMS
jgi:hypothetical protein